MTEDSLLDEGQLYNAIEKSTAKDLVKPQRLTEEEEKLLDEIDEQAPERSSQSDDEEFEKFLETQKEK